MGTTIDNCINNGYPIESYGSETISWSVISKTYTLAYGTAGGIVGRSDNSTVSNCINAGGVSGGADTNGALNGGIVGYAENNSVMKLCKNTGRILYGLLSGISKNGGGIGGIVGFLHDSEVNQSYNTGIVTGVHPMSGNFSTQCIGGIAGYGCGATLKNCYNIGNISGNNNVGGIYGLFEREATRNSYVYNCYVATTNITAPERKNCR